MPGDNLTVLMRLSTTLPLQEGLRFALREGKSTIGKGVISRVLKSNTVPNSIARKTKSGELDPDSIWENVVGI